MLVRKGEQDEAVAFSRPPPAAVTTAAPRLSDAVRREAMSRRQFSCLSCNAHKCCALFEYCVACCMQPMWASNLQTQVKHLVMSQSRRYMALTRASSVFDICNVLCHTSSASIEHENRYATEYKHCYVARRGSHGDESAGQMLHDEDLNFDSSGGRSTSRISSQSRASRFK